MENMKTAVVYYSRDGSTRVAAKVLAQKFGGEVFELEEEKKRGDAASQFMAAAFGALIGKKSKLKNSYAREMRNYDRICIGTPIWAAKAAPAVNAFISALDAKDKEIIIFTLQADPKPTSKGANILRRKLEKNGGSVTDVIPLHGAGVGRTAEEAHIKAQIDAEK